MMYKIIVVLLCRHLGCHTIEQGRLKFETPKKPMKIDGHPFPANMVDVGGKRNTLQTKVLTS